MGNGDWHEAFQTFLVFLEPRDSQGFQTAGVNIRDLEFLIVGFEQFGCRLGSDYCVGDFQLRFLLAV